MSVQIRYVKRLQMSLDFAQTTLERPELPTGFFWKEWSTDLVKTHARLIHVAFSKDLDGRIFPTYKHYGACEHLVVATSAASFFAPYATWLIGRCSSKNDKNTDFCAAIQCVRKNKKEGEIQNVSVIPSFRRQGLGRALVLKALESFKTIGVKRVLLEATAENAVAVRMYDSLGFRLIRFFYTESFVESGFPLQNL